jgi:hypothetical protein
MVSFVGYSINVRIETMDFCFSIER